MPRAVMSERQRQRAKQLRRPITRAETLLWRYLNADQRCDALLVSEGFRVLRFTNAQVMSNLEGVVEVIRQAAAGASGAPPSPTLPHKGGGSRETVANHLTDANCSRG